MKVFHDYNAIARLALAVTGRRVTQRFNLRLLHISSKARGEGPQTRNATAPKLHDVLKCDTLARLRRRGDVQRHLHTSSPPKVRKKKAKKPPPSPKPKSKSKPRKNTPATVSATSASLARSESLRNALLNNLKREGSVCPEKLGKTDEEMKAFLRAMVNRFKDHEQNAGRSAPEEDVVGNLGGGFRPEEWSDGWGRDELAPPAAEGGSASSPASSSSTFRRRRPPHCPFPYVRRTEGYIPDDGSVEKCTSVLQDIESPSEHKPIAQLAHGLDRVLFNPGVHWLQDPRSRVYNFTPWIESIPKVTDFAFERITGFVKSSKDTDLHTLAKRHKRPFAGSTSSLTGLLSHIYFLISGDRDVDTSTLSRAFAHEPTRFTPGQRMPTSVVLNYNEGVWSIDADKADELAEKNVLTWMGTMLEKFLTLSEGEFRMLLRSTSAEDCGEDRDPRREAYRYAMSDHLVLRSQLDCVDSRLPGTGVFDIKTRAAVPIRLDVLNYEENSGYLIKTLTGALESFEKEYYDLIRSAFLKYSFQVRIGNMDGVLIAYHNTARLFGFQYVSLEEMEATLYGPGNGTRVFNKCVMLLEKVLSDVAGVYGERSVRCTFETRERSQQLNVWIEPAEWDEQVEGKPCPIAQLDIEVASFLQGESEAVRGARAVADDRAWLLHWRISQSALDAADIRANLENAQSRQFRVLSFPAGIETMKEMEERWESLNYGGGPFEPLKTRTLQDLVGLTTKDQVEAKGEGEGVTASSEGVGSGVGVGVGVGKEMEKEKIDSHAPPPPTSDSRLQSPSSVFRSMEFRPANRGIEMLRQLALEGRDETRREQAEGREKVVWGVALPSCREALDSEPVEGGDVDGAPGVEDDLAEVGGVGVEVGDGATVLGRSIVEPVIPEEGGRGHTTPDAEGVTRVGSDRPIPHTSEPGPDPLSG